MEPVNFRLRLIQGDGSGPRRCGEVDVVLKCQVAARQDKEREHGGDPAASAHPRLLAGDTNLKPRWSDLRKPTPLFFPQHCKPRTAMAFALQSEKAEGERKKAHLE